MTSDEQNDEIAHMARERASLKRELVCMDNRLGRYQKALLQASGALAQGIHLRAQGAGVMVPAIDGLHEAQQERELPSLPEIAKLQADRDSARGRLKELDTALDALGIA